MSCAKTSEGRCAMDPIGLEWHRVVDLAEPNFQSFRVYFFLRLSAKLSATVLKETALKLATIGLVTFEKRALILISPHGGSSKSHPVRSLVSASLSKVASWKMAFLGPIASRTTRSADIFRCYPLTLGEAGTSSLTRASAKFVRSPA